MSIHLSFRVEPEVKEKLEQRAKARNQTITAYVLDKIIFEPEQKENLQQTEELNKVLLEQVHQKDRQIEELLEELQKIILEKERQSFWKKLFPRN